MSQTIEQHGYAVPLTALQDGVRGLWTVLTLSATGRGETYTVGKEAVEVLHLEGEQAFVRGTIDGDAMIVREGTHRVVPGDRVRLGDTPAVAETR